MIAFGPVIGYAAVVGLLAALHQTVGLGAPGWVTGLLAGATVNLLLARGLAGRRLVGRHRPGLGPADRVTLTRSVLVCGVAALTADSFGRPTPVAVFVGLSVIALALDAIDGPVARRTGTACPFGARFDMEVDAFLILALSVHVGRAVGWWVLAIGAAHYALVVAARWAPWLGRPLPARRWRKLVAAAQGIALTLAAAQVLDTTWTTVTLLVALAMLVTSFGTEIWSLWRHRLPQADELPVADEETIGPAVTDHALGGRGRQWRA